MKKCLSILFAVLIAIISCKSDVSVNEYIFPYIEFTLSEDGSYYSASVVKGAALKEIYIPAFVDSSGDAIPVKYFTGFQQDGDEKNLTKTVFESSMTEIKLKSLDQASILNTLKYNTIDESYTTWNNLPDLVQREDKEFQGWYLVNNPDVQIHNGDVIVPGYSAVYAKWGEHAGFKYVDGQDPTCTEKGWEAYHYCPDCGYSTYKEIAALGHSIIKHEKCNPTCITVGYSADCYECSRCGLFFSDSDGKIEISKGSVVIPYSGHSSDGTIYKDEESHYLKCPICGEVYNKEDHTFGDWYVSEDEGYTQQRDCTYCGYIEKSAAGHSWELVPDRDSTCTEKGHIAYWQCTKHSGEYSISDNPIEIINEAKLHELADKDLIPHDLSDWKKTSKEHWKVCSICSEVFDEGEHDFEYTFIVDSANRSMIVERACIVCGAQYDDQSSGSSAFDISAAFGAIDATRVKGNSWTLSYTRMGAADCYWTDEKGNTLITGPDPFTVTYPAGGSGRFIVYCHELNSRGDEVDIAFVALTTY